MWCWELLRKLFFFLAHVSPICLNRCIWLIFRLLLNYRLCIRAFDLQLILLRLKVLSNKCIFSDLVKKNLIGFVSQFTVVWFCDPPRDHLPLRNICFCIPPLIIILSSVVCVHSWTSAKYERSSFINDLSKQHPVVFKCSIFLNFFIWFYWFYIFCFFGIFLLLLLVIYLFVFNSRTAIAGAIIGLLLVFYNSTNLNCIGALSFF